MRPGRAATRFASSSVAGTTSSTGQSGVTGSGTTPRYPANSVHAQRPSRNADRQADEKPDSGDDRRLPGDGGGNLATGEAERLQDGEVTPAAPGKRDERVRERRDRHGAEDAHDHAGHAVDAAEPADVARPHRVARPAEPEPRVEELREGIVRVQPGGRSGVEQAAACFRNELLQALERRRSTECRARARGSRRCRA